MMHLPTDTGLLVGYAFAFGAAVGSFANVCIFRMPRKRRYLDELHEEMQRGPQEAVRENLEAQIKVLEKEVLNEGCSIAKPRSFCPACKRMIPWHDNIPLLSYALLNGRCRTCKVRIPWRYPLVEALMGGLFALLAWKHLSAPGEMPFPVLVVLAAFTACLVIVTFIDVDWRIIPYPLSLGIAALAVPVSMLMPRLHVALWPPWSAEPVSSRLEAAVASLAGIVVGAGCMSLMGFLGMGLLWVKQTLKSNPSLERLLSGFSLTRWLVTGPSDPLRDIAVGGGDLNLMAAVGGLLGWKAALVVSFFLAPLVGSVVGVACLLLTKDRYMPYGPFLALGSIVFIVCGKDILAWAGPVLERCSRLAAA